MSGCKTQRRRIILKKNTHFWASTKLKVFKTNLQLKMGSVGAKAIKRTEKEKEEEYIDWDARKNQTQKVGRLSLIVRAMRTANRTAALTDGGATSATNE